MISLPSFNVNFNCVHKMINTEYVECLKWLLTLELFSSYKSSLLPLSALFFSRSPIDFLNPSFFMCPQMFLKLVSVLA